MSGMKVTKLAHSCLLVETDDAVALFDPGSMSYESHLLDIAQLPRLTYIIITHSHPDHFSEAFVAELVAQFSEVIIITTAEIVETLAEKNIIAQTTGTEDVVVFELAHESMVPLVPEAHMCQNIGVHYLNKLTHPGDSYALTETKEILALPVAGPWAAPIDGVRLGTILKPTTIIPIHDWMHKDAARSSSYDWFEGYFTGIGVRFLKMVDGEPVEL
jgi:L-ascorbate metabolism protein UlaG (beta-lactamase superfamily)